MKQKIEQLKQKYNLSSGALAEMLEIQPAVISHLKSGRNKPSFEVIQKILQRFPEINPDWLLLDSEQMFRDGAVASEPENDLPTNLFSEYASSGQHNATVENSAPSETPNMAKISTSRESNISELPAEMSKISNSHASSKIERVIVIYSDGTFQDFKNR